MPDKNVSSAAGRPASPAARVAPASAAPINLTNHFLIAMPGLEDELFGKSVVYLCEHNENGALGLMINKPSDFNLQHLFDKVELPMRRNDLAEQPVFQGGPVQTEHGFVLHDAMSDGLVAGLPAVRVHQGGLRQRSAAEAARLVEQALSEERDDGSAGQDDPAAVLIHDAYLQGGQPEPAGDDPIILPHEPAQAASAEEEPESAYASTLRIPGGGLEMTTSRDVLEAVASGAGPRRLLVSLGYASWAQGQLESELAENNWLTVSADPAIIFETPVEQRYSRALSLLGIHEYMLSQQVGHA